jgi:hypothetical protein
MTRRWQFSIRGILFLTAIVSGVLAFAVRMPAFFQSLLIAAVPILFVVGLLQGANLATSDRRPRMAAVAWSTLGLFFAFYPGALVWQLFQIEFDSRSLPPFLLSIGIVGGSFLACVFRAYRACRLVFAPTDCGDGDLKSTNFAKDRS